MGSDKSLLIVDGQTFVTRIGENLLAVTDKVTIVGGHSADSQFSAVPDVYPEWGALGGLHGALTACSRNWAAVVACDLPFVSSALITRLAMLRERTDAVVPMQPDGRLQPLCAFYKKDPCLSKATELIEQGRRRPLDLLEAITTRAVPFSELQDLPGAERFFVNINTPEDYYEATGKVIRRSSHNN